MAHISYNLYSEHQWIN